MLNRQLNRNVTVAQMVSRSHDIHRRVSRDSHDRFRFGENTGDRPTWLSALAGNLLIRRFLHPPFSHPTLMSRVEQVAVL